MEICNHTFESILQVYGDKKIVHIYIYTSTNYNLFNISQFYLKLSLIYESRKSVNKEI